jgi:hypothetical protein
MIKVILTLKCKKCGESLSFCESNFRDKESEKFKEFCKFSRVKILSICSRCHIPLTLEMEIFN